MWRFISKLASAVNPAEKARAAKRRERRASPQVEALERRELLSGTPLSASPGLLIAVSPPPDPIQAKYQDLGGPGGILGATVSGEMATPYGGGLYERFQSGAIFWSARTGAHDLYGSAADKYFAAASERDGYGTPVQQILGLPTADETSMPGVPGTLVSNFQGGGIYFYPGSLNVWSPFTSNDAHVVYGAIAGEYAATAHMSDASGHAVQQILGAPTSDEMNVPGVPGARMNTFQGGAIYWSPSTGARAVYGAIGAKYNSLGGAAAYGLPTSDEQIIPDGQLISHIRVSYFQDGRAIYWSAATGAHAVYGAIGARYVQLGGPTGLLGLPRTDEQSWSGAPGGRVSYFEHGAIYWTPSLGALEQVSISGVPSGSPQTDGWSCGPNSAARFLQFYGYNVTYDFMRLQVQFSGDLVSLVQMGTRPDTLLHAIQVWRPETQMETRVDVAYGEGGLNRILDLVASGKPVIALINPTGQSHDVANFGFVTGGHIPNELHWVVVTGYNRMARTVTYMDTDGKLKTLSFDQFNQDWNWSAGGAAGDFLTGTLNVHERTIIY
jgi:uncharacterized protein with LGFP repeats